MSAPRLLWVEGKDDSAVVQSLCQHADVPYVFHVEDKGGVGKVLAGLGVALRAPNLERFGVVVDANGDAQSRWEGIRSRAEAEGYAGLPGPLPPGGVIARSTEGLPRFGAWIMPDNSSAGAIEEFAMKLVRPADPVLAHAAGVLDRLPADVRRFPETQRSKALIRTWLAWQEEPGSPMGQAITKGDLDGHAPAAREFVEWLKRLMVND